MENWEPLSQFEEFSAPPPPMPPLPGEEIETGRGEAIDVPAGLPWDHRRQLGFFPAFAETAWMVLLNPTEAFARMYVAGSLSDPLLYNLIGGWFGAIACGIYLVLTVRMQPPQGDLTGARALFAITPAVAMRELKVFVIMGPVIVTVSTLVFSAIAHLFLMLAGGAHKAYHVTLRVFCFSYGSSQLLQLVPFCGNLIAPMWMMVCCVVGLAIAHGTTTGRSVAAMGLFLVACFLCCAGVLLLAAGADYQSLRPLLSQ